MYNRYIQNDNGGYCPVPPPDSPPPSGGEPSAAGEGGFLQKILGRLKLKDIDTGDLLLL